MGSQLMRDGIPNERIKSNRWLRLQIGYQAIMDCARQAKSILCAINICTKMTMFYDFLVNTCRKLYNNLRIHHLSQNQKKSTLFHASLLEILNFGVPLEKIWRKLDNIQWNSHFCSHLTLIYEFWKKLSNATHFSRKKALKVYFI